MSDVAGIRTSIPDDIAAHVLFAHDRTCCICRIRGRHIQIHHIDENPTNHEEKNLAVLCMDCHTETQLSGGFGRKLSSSEVRIARDEWISAVAIRRARAEDLIIAGQVKPSSFRDDYSYEEWRRPSDEALRSFVSHIPDVLETAFKQVAPKLETGVTLEMADAKLSIIEVIRRLLVLLSAWYPPGHFGAQSLDDFFANLQAERFQLYRKLWENGGPGGTILTVIIPHSVQQELLNLLVTMVESLLMGDEFDTVGWRKRVDAFADA
jgi:hypothetical protein